MSASGLEVFDKTTHETNVWLKEIMAEIGPDRQRAYHALRAVLHALRDRLTVDQAAHLSAQLPMLIRGIYFEGWHPAGTPTKERTQEDFLAHVAEGLKGIEPINPETAARSVFRTVANHVSAGEVEHVKDALPKPVRTLWP
jgi:uncharacterized protein (DUF2267 family)